MQDASFTPTWWLGVVLAHVAQSALDAVIEILRVGLDCCLDESEIAGCLHNSIVRVLMVLLLFASVIPGAANEALSVSSVIADGCQSPGLQPKCSGWFLRLRIILFLRSLLVSWLSAGLLRCLPSRCLGVALRFFSRTTLVLTAERKRKAPAEFGNKLPVEEVKGPLVFLRIDVV